MAGTSELERVTAVVLRFMRTPLLLLLGVYTVGVTGMALMPGPEINGEPSRMNLFHAFYFFTYTATTTGFGEIPVEFSDEQRLWAIICLFLGVIAWLYAIGSIIRLAQHPEFLRAVAERRFAASVRRITRPYFVICGFGDTGSLLARGLSDYSRRAAVIDIDSERIKALDLRNYRVKMFGLCGDASIPRHLLDAGVDRLNCQAVVALTPDDKVNLKIAVMARSLNPGVRIICRSTDKSLREHLDLIGGVMPIDPFETFARQLSTTLRVPLLYLWEEWLLGVEGIDLSKPVNPPTGTWILCGYGRMGRAVHKALREHEVPVVVIEPREQQDDIGATTIKGTAGTGNLKTAGVVEAAGIVAGTDNDEDNLSILLGARALNSDAFLVVRQNHHENELAFNAANANLIMQPSLVMARNILLTLVAPMMEDFSDYLRREGRVLVPELANLTQKIFAGGKAKLWAEHISDQASTIDALRQRGIKPTLRDLARDPADRERHMRLLALVLKRGEDLIMLPRSDRELLPDDTILYCGSDRARRLLDGTLSNPYTLHYLNTGLDEPRSWFGQWLARTVHQPDQKTG